MQFQLLLSRAKFTILLQMLQRNLQEAMTLPDMVADFSILLTSLN